MNKLRVALLGGSFNPSTIAHMRMGSQVLEGRKADKVIYIPCGARTDKPELISGDQRIDLLRVDIRRHFGIDPPVIDSDEPNALDRREPVLIDEFEIKKFKRIMPTSWLISKYRRTFPDVHFTTVIGSDLLDSMRTWEDYNEVLQFEDYIVFERDERAVDLGKMPFNSELIVDKKMSMISSTEVRKILKLGWKSRDLPECKLIHQKLLKFVSREVLDHVLERRLYRPK